MSDVDRDGRVELVVALTDRVVRVYRWQDDALRAISKCELMQQVRYRDPPTASQRVRETSPILYQMTVADLSTGLVGF